jgi:hypothetical protein
LIKRLQGLGRHFCLVKAHDKDPSVGGKGWQKQENLMFADDPKLQAHLKNGGNYGVVGGFGLVIADADTPEIKQISEEKLPETFTVESPGSKGWHTYFLCGLEKPIRLRDKDGENVGDIQGPAKMVVGPGSIHPNGGVYRIIKDMPLAQVTAQQLREAFKDWAIPEKEFQQVEFAADQEKQNNVDLDILQVVPLSGLQKRGSEYFGPHPVHGSNTKQNFWVNPSKNCWHCFRHGSGGGPLLWLAVEEGLIDCSEAGSGALRGETFKRTMEKAQERGLIQERQIKEKKPKVNGAVASDDGKHSQADMLILLCLEQKPELFHDQHDTPYARIKQKNVNVIFPIKSRSFKVWLANLLWEEMKKAPSADALAGALNVLQAKALYEGLKHTLYNRVAPAPDGFWIDMVDEGWRAIKVTAKGWKIVNDPPILFKRFSHQKPLPTPDPEGSPWGILDFINIDKKDEATRLLFLCAVISYLIPLIPHVIVILYGIQGSGKSTLFKIVRQVVDPSAVEVLTLPRNERERVQQLDHHWCAFYDNVAHLPTWMSDTLCRAATGGGFTKRELYTDDQDIIYNFKRCVGLNGINIAAQRGDLLDRSLLVGLEDIPKKKRRTEEQLLQDFEACKGLILGGFLNTLVKAIDEYPYVQPKELFRMADFTRWGCAIARALGKTEKDFLNAYAVKVKLQIEEAAHSSPVATVLIDYLSNHKNWEGAPSSLYKILLGHAKEMGISTRQKAFPKAPHILVRKLNELAPSLKALGIKVVTGIHTGTTRRILINSVSSVPSVSEYGENNATNATNATFPSSSGRIDEAFQIQCFDCGATLGQHEVYSFGGHHFCRKCRLKIEAQKKKKEWRCPQLTTLEGAPFCNVIQSILAKPEQCSPDCSLLKEEALK